MAYANLLSVDCAENIEFFCRMRDFICKRNGTYDYSSTGIGWTLHDSSYAVDEDNPEEDDWYVIYSPGEGGNDDMYFKIDWGAATTIEVLGYLYWNNSTHAGVVGTASHHNWLVGAVSDDYILTVAGDLDQVVCLDEISANTYRATGFGRLEPVIVADDIALCSASPSSGSDVSIEVDAVPSGWAVGRKIFIRDIAGIEQVEIKTLVGTTITADLTNSYTTPKLSEHVGYYNVNGNSYFPTGLMPLIENNGTAGGNTGLNSTFLGVNDWTDPEPLNSQYALLDIHIGHTTYGWLGKLKNVKSVDPTGLTDKDVLEEDDGTEWRWRTTTTYFLNLAIKEV